MWKEPLVTSNDNNSTVFEALALNVIDEILSRKDEMLKKIMGLVMVLRGIPVLGQQSQRPAQKNTFALPRRQPLSGS